MLWGKTGKLSGSEVDFAWSSCSAPFSASATVSCVPGSASCIETSTIVFSNGCVFSEICLKPSTAGKAGRLVVSIGSIVSILVFVSVDRCSFFLTSSSSLDISTTLFTCLDLSPDIAFTFAFAFRGLPGLRFSFSASFSNGAARATSEPFDCPLGSTATLSVIRFRTKGEEGSEIVDGSAGGGDVGGGTYSPTMTISSLNKSLGSGFTEGCFDLVGGLVVGATVIICSALDSNSGMVLDNVRLCVVVFRDGFGSTTSGLSLSGSTTFAFEPLREGAIPSSLALVITLDFDLEDFRIGSSSSTSAGALDLALERVVFRTVLVTSPSDCTVASVLATDLDLVALPFDLTVRGASAGFTTSFSTSDCVGTSAFTTDLDLVFFFLTVGGASMASSASSTSSVTPFKPDRLVLLELLLGILADDVRDFE